MDLCDFDRDVLKEVSTRTAAFPSGDLHETYYDVLQICAEIGSLENRRLGEVLFSENISVGVKQSAYYQYRLISVFLKSGFMLSDIFISKFIGAVHGRPWMSMHTFVREGNCRFNDLTQEELLPAYCVAAYRNKLVAHYDERRMGSYTTAADGSRTLSPLPDAFYIDMGDVDELRRIQRKHQGVLPHLAGIDNHFELLNALFYSVPVQVRGENLDRKVVDRIAQKGGCESKPARYLVVAIDSFCLGVLRCIS